MDNVFLNLPDLVDDRGSIAESFDKDHWRAVQYVTKMGEGIMLLAAEEASPKAISFHIGLTGWYRVFIGIPHLRCENYTYLKLSDDLCYTGFHQASRGNPMEWAGEEYAEEVYFCTSDLTNRDILMSKPNFLSPNTAGIAWIRCEKLSENEINGFLRMETQKIKCVQMHIR